MKSLEASDITKLLRELAHTHNDATCLNLARMADHHNLSVLELAHAAITVLVQEKAAYFKIANDATNLKFPAPIIVRKSEINP